MLASKSGMLTPLLERYNIAPFAQPFLKQYFIKTTTAICFKSITHSLWLLRSPAFQTLMPGNNNVKKNDNKPKPNKKPKEKKQLLGFYSSSSWGLFFLTVVLLILLLTETWQRTSKSQPVLQLQSCSYSPAFNPRPHQRYHSCIPGRFYCLLF